MAVSRRLALAGLSAAAAVGIAPGGALAQGRPLRILVGYPPGGAVDIVAREIGEELRAAGYAVVVENRPGAAGRLAVEQMLQLAPDGNAVVFMPGGNYALFPHVYPQLRYKPDDLAPIAGVCAFGFGLAVGPGAPVADLQAFVAWAKANPTKASFATPGGGTAMHFMGVKFAKAAGIALQHIPYRGGAPALVDVQGGTVPAIATTLPNLVALHGQGVVRTLAVSLEARMAALPGVPTFKELGYADFVITENFGFFASARIPAAMLDTLNRAIVEAAAKPRFTAAIARQGFDPLVMARAAYDAHMKDDLRRWGPIVAETGYRAED